MHLTLRQRVLFAIGTPGWQITASVVVSIGIYFYLPPEGAYLHANPDKALYILFRPLLES